jgi:2-polyprenyl-3-methyl-5-hydroxy-6-metoxy-1,4-benzoquinol methylase
MIGTSAVIQTWGRRQELMLHTTTNSGLHAFVADRILKRYARAGMRAADLGTGPGAMADRLQSLGCEVLGADMSDNGFEANLPHAIVNFDQPDFASQLGTKKYNLVTAIEVIEHVESPIGFLRNIGNLLVSGGVAVVTTPNVESLPARLKFLLRGKIRTMDENGEPTHISPIFVDLLKRQFLKRTSLELEEHHVFPADGFQLSRKSFAMVLSTVASILPGESLKGDNHVWVLRAKE